MPNMTNKPVQWILWPFQALWRLLTWILELTGRLILGVIGFILVAVGIVLSLSVIGAIVGIPMVLLGFLMMLRAVFD
jgi:hypothetical protein